MARKKNIKRQIKKNIQEATHNIFLVLPISKRPWHGLEKDDGFSANNIVV
jgi:hypothetical protein